MKRFLLPGLVMLMLVAIIICIVPVSKEICISDSGVVYNENSSEEQISIKIEGKIRQYLLQKDVFDGKVILDETVLETKYGSLVHETPDKKYNVISYAAFDSNKNEMNPLLIVFNKDFQMAAIKYGDAVYLCNPLKLTYDDMFSFLGK